ncbi:MAG: GAF domain-containing protein [bacterium]
MKQKNKETPASLRQENNLLHKIAGIISSNLEISDILKEILEIFTDLTKGDSCFIYIHNKKTHSLILKASKNPHHNIITSIKLKIGEGLTGWAAQNKNPVSISSGAYNDPRFKSIAELPEDQFEAFLSIPILSKDEMIGVINIQHKNKHTYSASQINLLFTIAKYLGSAVQNALSHDMVQKKDEQLDILSKISSTITSDTYLDEILHLIAALTAQVMNSKICSIMLLDEKNQKLVIAATQSLSDNYKNKPPVKVGQSISGKAVRNKKPVMVKDVTKDKDYMFPEIAAKENIVSMLSLPMMIKDKVIGVINSYTEKEHEFTKEEIDMFQAIANQSAVAIENTRLNEEVFEAREKLETRKLIERAKGILMKNLSTSEDDAFKKMQKKSMDLRKSMKEIAEAIILASDIE